MKTTLEIPDPVFRRAKTRAAQKGIPLRQFVTEAVEDRLLRDRDLAANRKTLRELSGGLRHLKEENKRIRDLIEAEFRQIEPEMWK